jgi:hypothetical protein
MEQRFGHDFSKVRVHSAASAAQSATDVMAHAYTVGHDVVFGAGQYAPGTHAGRRLIAHELAHVVQQSEARAVPDGQIDNQSVLFPITWHPTHALMRAPDEKDQSAGKPPPAADPCTAPDAKLPVYKPAEQKQRDEILQDMLRGLTTDEKNQLCMRFRRALGAFSTSQMVTMKAAGVRFWRSGEFPPPFKDEYAPSKTRHKEIARYQHNYRIIQWGSKAGVDAIRHELAHAWDHVRGGKVPRLDSYKGAQLRKAVLAPANFSSESAEKRTTIEETVEGKQKKVGLSIKDTFDRYMNRPAPPDWSFANSQTDPEHVTSDIKEFYAEGYSVFHSGNEEAQAQLLCYAPELYQLLETEANENKLAIPSRSVLAANSKTNKRKCV